jgi:Lon-like ATP-dependent protease
VHSVKDLHSVGTFCGIVEMQDMGDKIRMIVMAHRRVRLIGQVVLDEKELEAENDIIQVQDEKNGRRRRRRRAKGNGVIVEESSEGAFISTPATVAQPETPSLDVTATTTEEVKQQLPASTAGGLDPEEPAFEPIPVLMIEAENVQPLKYEMDTEIKVRKQQEGGGDQGDFGSIGLLSKVFFFACVVGFGTRGYSDY